MNNSVDGEDLIDEDLFTAKGSPPTSPLFYSPRGSQSEMRASSKFGGASKKSIVFPDEKRGGDKIDFNPTDKGRKSEELAAKISIPIPEKGGQKKPSLFQVPKKPAEGENKTEGKENQEEMNDEIWRFIYSVPNEDAKKKIVERSEVSKPLRLGFGGLLKGVGIGSKHGTPKVEGEKRKVVLPLLNLKSSAVEAGGMVTKTDKVMLVDNLRQTKLDHLAEYMEKNQMMSGLLEMVTSTREEEEGNLVVNSSDMKESNLGTLDLVQMFSLQLRGS